MDNFTKQKFFLRNTLSLIMIVISLTRAVGQQSKAVLTVGISTLDDSERRVTIMKPLQDYLTDKLGREVKVVAEDNYLKIVEKLESGEFDMAYLNSFGYILAKQNLELQPLLVKGKADGHTDFYRSCLITNYKAKIKNFQKLRHDAAGMVMYFSNPSSPSGHLLPRLFLQNQELDPNSSFKQVIYQGSDRNVVDAVQRGTASVGACSCNYLETIKDSDTYDQKKIDIIWKSDSIPYGPFVVRKDLSDNLKENFSRAFIDMPKDHELWSHMQVWMRNKSQVYLSGQDVFYEKLLHTTVGEERLSALLDYYN